MQHFYNTPFSGPLLENIVLKYVHLPQRVHKRECGYEYEVSLPQSTGKVIN